MTERREGGKWKEGGREGRIYIFLIRALIRSVYRFLIWVQHLHIFSRALFYPSCLWATLTSPFWQTPICLWCLSCFLLLNQSYIHRMKPICHEITHLCIVTGIFLFWIFWCMTRIVIWSSYYKVYINFSTGDT